MEAFRRRWKERPSEASSAERGTFQSVAALLEWEEGYGEHVWTGRT